MSANLARNDCYWKPEPDAERAFCRMLDGAFGRCPRAVAFAETLIATTAIRLRDIIDHIALADDADVKLIEAAGWRKGADGAWRNHDGAFPAFLRRDRFEVWLRVESAERFAAAHANDALIEGKNHGSMRRAVAFAGKDVVLGVIERNGFAGFDPPDDTDAMIRQARVSLQRFRSRRREFDATETALNHTESIVDDVVGGLGPHWACALWLRAEREYWMRRCRAGDLQKQRQDAVGIGWANIDHYTYDGSRRHFRRTIAILRKLGFELREMLYAGELAGWGSQVLEQPVIGSTIFADVDLAPDELTVDFVHEELPDLPMHRRAGLLSALLGESILEAGLNHVAGLYDQKAFRVQMANSGVSMMPPFTDFAHLYQELTTGDWAPVDPARIDTLERGGHIGAEEAERLRVDGSIIAHLENIERNEGYKGFNREGIDSVLRKLDPRAYRAPIGEQK